MHLHLHKAVVKIQDPDLVYSHLVQCVCVCVCVCERERELRQRECADQGGLRRSKADLDSDHVLAIFGEHPDLSYMT